MSESDLFERARGIRAAIKAHEQQLADQNYNKMRESRLRDLRKAIAAFAAAVDDAAHAQEHGLTVSLAASVPPAVEVNDPTEFLAGNELSRLEETLHAAIASMDESIDSAFESAIAKIDAHPAGRHELEILEELELESSATALQALAEASRRWSTEVVRPKRPDLGVAESIARELDEAWSSLAESGITHRQIDLLRRLSGDCVPLTTLGLDDIAWVFEVGFASTLRLCSNSSRR